MPPSAARCLPVRRRRAPGRFEMLVHNYHPCVRDTEHSNSRRKADLDVDAFSEDDADGDEIDAYAQELAEGIMEDGNHDGEDSDMADWNDSDDEEEPTLEGEDEDMPEFAAPEER
ncbi:hypothetical protein DVH05_015764 [Phytophthora capsici]|nr:hypothetical protein DVH05_015764 [Phytophthora capsici]